SLYDVISNTGKIVPAMCYHYTFDPFGSCGMCLVTVEGKKAPVRSCTAKAAAGMVVRTDGDDLFQARKKAVEKHLSVHPLDCPVGAITNKYSKYLYKPWQLRKTTTTCNYCGDGCQMHLETKDNEVVRVTSPLSWKNKWGDRADTATGHGGICVRGRFGFQY